MIRKSPWSHLEFSSVGTPSSKERIEEIQRRIGFSLPPDFQTFLAEIGGGELSLERRIDLPGSIREKSQYDLSVGLILGNGEDDLDLSVESFQLAEEWDVPSGLLVFSHAEGIMDECYAFDFRDNPLSARSIVLVSDYIDGRTVDICETFTDFCENIVEVSDI